MQKLLLKRRSLLLLRRYFDKKEGAGRRLGRQSQWCDRRTDCRCRTRRIRRETELEELDEMRWRENEKTYEKKYEEKCEKEYEEKYEKEYEEKYEK